MAIELDKETRKLAIASIERYFRENMEEPIGNVAAGGLLGYLLEEIGPAIYNRAVADVQERLQARGYDVGNVDGLIGFKTRVAIGTWQKRAGMAETCFPDAKLVRTIGTGG